MKACLTRWAVAALSKDEEAAAGVQLVLQGVDVRPLSPTQERYRMSLSDGGHLMRGILLTSMNHLVKDGRLRNGAVVCLLKFVCRTIECLSMIIVIQLEVLQTECALIGNPKPCELRCMEKPYGLEMKCVESCAKSVANSAQPNNGAYSSGQHLKGLLTQGAVAAIIGRRGGGGAAASDAGG